MSPWNYPEVLAGASPSAHPLASRSTGPRPCPQAVINFGYGFVHTDPRFPTQINGSRIETFIEQHRAYTRACLAVRDCPMHGRSAAVFRQDRTMYIDTTVGRKVEQPRWKNFSV